MDRFELRDEGALSYGELAAKRGERGRQVEMVGRWSTFGSNWVAECPECHSVCVFWDEDDLDDEGRLLCDSCEFGS